MMEDIGHGEKMFVLKRSPPLRPEEVLPIYAALNEAGPELAAVDAAPPTRRTSRERSNTLLPGLLRGYIDRFAPNGKRPRSVDAGLDGDV